jgi:hypothetical protein
MTTCAIIPVKGRYPLLFWTVDRLKTVNKIDHIILVGHEKEGEDAARAMNVDWLYHPNDPLGAKCNTGWQFALKKYDPDYYVFVGSGDWLSENYIPEMIPYLNEFDMVGRPDMYLLNIGSHGNRMCHWSGYLDARRGEPIGIGRMLRRSIVQKMQGNPFNSSIDQSLDHSMITNIHLLGGSYFLVTEPLNASLAISCYKWPHRHAFDDYWRGCDGSKLMGDGKPFLKEYFPQALQMTL